MSRATKRWTVTRRGSSSWDDHLPSEPTLEGHGDEGPLGRNEDAPFTAVVAPGQEGGGQDQKADRHPHDAIDVLDPGQLEIEARRVDVGRQLVCARRRDPAVEAPRPVGTAQTGAGGAHESPQGHQQKGGENGGDHQFLEAGHGARK